MIDTMISWGVFVLAAVSGSMEPTMQPGMSYTVDCHVSMDSLQEGDIIMFRPSDIALAHSISPDLEATTHRIVDIDHYDDGTVKHITTQGDNEETNPEPIEGVDLTDNLDRDQLLQLYVGKITLGDHLQELESVYDPDFAGTPTIAEIMGL